MFNTARRGTLAVAGLFWATVSVLSAHPGHGHTEGHSAEHFLTEPLHVVGIVAALAAIAAAVMLVRRSRRDRSASVVKVRKDSERN